MIGRPARTAEAGVSLVELMVVIVIAATLLALAIPVVRDDDSLNAAVREIANDAVTARSRATTRWETVTFDADPGAGAWRTLLADGTPVIDENTDANGWRYLSDIGFDMLLQGVSGAQTDARFLADGRVDQEAAIRVRKGDDAWEIRFHELSGRVTAERLP
jgi:prepilin-type N-terminal cleavage/methylation domain-containing protein